MSGSATIFMRRKRTRIAQRLPVAGQVIPVRHIDLRAALRGTLVIVRIAVHDAGLKQIRLSLPFFAKLMVADCAGTMMSVNPCFCHETKYRL